MSKLTQMAVRNAKPHEPAEKIADGAYPEVTLAEARVQRENARRQITDGLDPSHHTRSNG